MSGGPGFYRGTTHDQMPFFQNKEKKMIEEKKWPPEFEKIVEMGKVSWDIMKPWINRRITELVGFEDDILISYCLEQLTPHTDSDGNSNPICPKKLQITMTGFMGKKAGVFVKELWDLLLSAQDSTTGIPHRFLEEKKNRNEVKER